MEDYIDLRNYNSIEEFKAAIRKKADEQEASGHILCHVNDDDLIAFNEKNFAENMHSYVFGSHKEPLNTLGMNLSSTDSWVLQPGNKVTALMLTGDAARNAIRERFNQLGIPQYADKYLRKIKHPEIPRFILKRPGHRPDDISGFFSMSIFYGLFGARLLMIDPVYACDEWGRAFKWQCKNGKPLIVGGDGITIGYDDFYGVKTDVTEEFIKFDKFRMPTYITKGNYWLEQAKTNNVSNVDVDIDLDTYKDTVEKWVTWITDPKKVAVYKCPEDIAPTYVESTTPTYS